MPTKGMIMLITEEYKKLNQQLHNSPRKFGSDGYKRVDDIYNIITTNHLESLLDYGCGQEALWKGGVYKHKEVKGLKRRLRKYLKNIDFYYEGYDPCVKGKEHIVRSNYDVVTCTDVMEHIEEDCLRDVLDNIFRLTTFITYFVINFKPANKHLPDGRNAHLIQKSIWWWMNVMTISAKRIFKDFEFVEMENEYSHKEFTLVLINKEGANLNVTSSRV